MPFFRRLPLTAALIAMVFAATPAHAQTDAREIWELQGSGPESPFLGEVIASGPNVVTAVGARGFFIQTPPERTDGDPATSDGIYVFTGSRPEVEQGDLVVVAGRIEEFFGNTEFGEGGLTIEVVGTAPLPEPVTLTAPFPPAEPSIPAAFERYEGMLVSVEGATAVKGTSLFYAGEPREEREISVVLGYGRPFREPGLPYPAAGEAPTIAVFDNNPEVFEFGFEGAANSEGFATLEEVVTPGATLSGAGPVIYRFGRYQVWPLAGSLRVDTAAQQALPVPAPEPTPGELVVASQNVFNLFDLVNDPGKDDEDSSPRTPEDYALRLGKLAAQICEVLRSPDIIAVQEAEKTDVLEDLAVVVEARCGASYSAHLIEGNDGRGIDNGYMVRETVQVLDVYTIGANTVFEPTVGGTPGRLYDRPPLVLEAIYDPAGVAFPITVVNVHNKSFNNAEQPRFRELRYRQALFLAEFAQRRQESNPGAHLLLTGDFNAFQFNDGFAPSIPIIMGTAGTENQGAAWWPDFDTVEPDLINQTVVRVPAEERYSYIFDGSAQILDHMLTTQALDQYVSWVAFTRGNADAPADTREEPETPLSSSDHDGVVIAIQTAGYTPPAQQAPTSPPPPEPGSARGGGCAAALLAVGVVLAVRGRQASASPWAGRHPWWKMGAG